MIMFALGALPFISWSLSGVVGASGWARFTDAWFRFQCHGRLDRTLAVADRYFPVCSRCLGIYAGLAVAAVLARPTISPYFRRVWLFAAAALMVLEVLVQDLTGHPPMHGLRFLTGALLSYPVVLILIAAARATDGSASTSQAAR